MPTYKQNSSGELFADGAYPYEVADATESVSQNGNPQIVLHHDVFSADRTQKVRVIDQLVFTDTSSWKIDAFRESSGELVVGEKDVSLEAADCLGRKGRLQLKTDSYQGRTRNKVAYYLPLQGNGEEPSDGSSGPVVPGSQKKPF